MTIPSDGALCWTDEQYHEMAEQLRQYHAKFEDHIESIINEFGDNPTECLMMIGEYIELARHYRAHPNAERAD